MIIGEAEFNHSIIVTGPAPLFALAVMQALDALLEPGLLVIVPDMVRLEVLREIKTPGASDVVDWIRANEPARVRVASTEVCEEFVYLLEAKLECSSESASRSGRGRSACG